jgi:hypothetical protein
VTDTTRSTSTILRNVLGLVLLAVLVWAGYRVAAFSFGWFSSLRSELATAIVAAAATVIVSILSISGNKIFDRRATIEHEARLKKVPVYEQLISFLFGVLHQGKAGYPALTDAGTIRNYVEITENIIVWGSDSVVKAFGDFRVASLSPGEGQSFPRLLIALEDLMLAVRKDLGYKNKKLNRGDLLRIFINDLEQHRKALNLPKH